MNGKHDLNDFCELTELLTTIELTDNVKKDRTFRRLKFKMETGTIQPAYPQKDGIQMKKNKWKTIGVSAVALVVLCGAFSTTSFAQGMIQSILARFQIGNMEITQYDKAQADPGASRAVVNEQQPAGSESRREQAAPKHMTIAEARTATGLNFPVPTWFADHYQYVNSVLQGEHAVEVQYQKEGAFLSLLISSGGQNGISTTDEVKTETINGKNVYFANGIIIWEHEGFTYELYQMAEKDFDQETLGKIIASLSTDNN